MKRKPRRGADQETQAENRYPATQAMATAAELKIHRSLIGVSARVVVDCAASAVIVYAEALLEVPIRIDVPSGVKILYVAKTEDEEARLAEKGLSTLLVSDVGLSRLSQVRVAVLVAISRMLVAAADVVVCLSGIAGTKKIDVLTVVEVGHEFAPLFSGAVSDSRIGDVQPEVLERVIRLATELGAEGREGKPVGTIFVVGDSERVLELSKQLILNPFHGYPEGQRNILSDDLQETLKELSTIDGAFVVRGNGVVESAGTYLKPSGQGEFDLPRGFGARHQAAAAITDLTGAIAVAVSESSGAVTVFRAGQMAAELEKAQAGLSDRFH